MKLVNDYLWSNILLWGHLHVGPGTSNSSAGYRTTCIYSGLFGPFDSFTCAVVLISCVNFPVFSLLVGCCVA